MCILGKRLGILFYSSYRPEFQQAAYMKERLCPMYIFMMGDIRRNIIIYSTNFRVSDWSMMNAKLGYRVHIECNTEDAKGNTRKGPNVYTKLKEKANCQFPLSNQNIAKEFQENAKNTDRVECLANMGDCEKSKAKKF